MTQFRRNERFNDGPNAYAFRLAGYNRDVNYIQAMTRREYGCDIPVGIIGEYVEKHERDKRKARLAVENREESISYARAGDDYDPRLPSLRKKHEAQKRKAAFEQWADGLRDAPPKVVSYKRWQGGNVNLKIDEIRANTKVEKPIGSSAKLLVHAVAKAFYIAPDDLLSDRRNKVLVAARAVIAKLLRERNSDVWSYPKIARAIGRKDHSTVINLIDTWEQRCRQIPAMREVYKMMGGKDAA